MPRDELHEPDRRLRLDLRTAFVLGVGFAAGATTFGIVVALLVGLALQLSIRSWVGP